MGTRLLISEAAPRLGISLDVARKQVQRGQIPAEKVGNRWYILMDKIDLDPPPSETISDSSKTESFPVSDDLRPERDGDVAMLREFLTSKEEEVAFLRSELASRAEEMIKQREQWAEESRRKDVILHELSTQLKALPAAIVEEQLTKETVIAAVAPAEDVSSPWQKFLGWLRV